MERTLLIKKLLSIIKEKTIAHNTDAIDLEVSLADLYGLDSVKYIELILAIEQEFGFEFDINDLQMGNFESINKIADTVLNHLSP